MDIPLKIGYCGEPKVGKSHLAATFVKAFDGLYLDFAGVYQYKEGPRDAPKYHVSPLKFGEAYLACKHVGLDVDKQYLYIKTWKDLSNAIDYAFVYRDTISKKPSKRIWIVFDDTVMWRWHTAIYVQHKNEHKSITKDDWGQATTEMTMLLRRLEAEFNLLFIHQMQDTYVDGENTGERKGRWLPTGIEYALDVVGMLDVDRSSYPFTQKFHVIANRMCWACSDEFVAEIPSPTAETLVDCLKIPRELV